MHISDLSSSDLHRFGSAHPTISSIATRKKKMNATIYHILNIYLQKQLDAGKKSSKDLMLRTFCRLPLLNGKLNKLHVKKKTTNERYDCEFSTHTHKTWPHVYRMQNRLSLLQVSATHSRHNIMKISSINSNLITLLSGKTKLRAKYLHNKAVTTTDDENCTVNVGEEVWMLWHVRVPHARRRMILHIESARIVIQIIHSCDLWEDTISYISIWRLCDASDVFVAYNPDIALHFGCQLLETCL